MSNVGNMWSPFPSASSAASIPTRALISALTLPFAQDGLSVWCNEAGFQGPFYFSLTSGAVVNGTTVLSTSVGGNSRWLAVPMTAPTPAAFPATYAGGKINPNGTIAVNSGLLSSVHLGAGRYDVTTIATNANNLALVTILDDVKVKWAIENLSSTVARVVTWNVADILTDVAFFIVFFKTV